MSHPRLPDIFEKLLPRALPGDLAPGATVAASGAASAIVPLLGADRFRLRFQCDRVGTLSFEFLGRDGQTAYGANNPTNVATAVDTETKLDIDPLFGEPYLKITFTEGGAGIATIATADALYGY